MYIGRRSKKAFLAWAFVSLVFGAWITWESEQGSPMPSPTALKSLQGKVEWVQTGKYGVKFAIYGASLPLDYASKGKAMGLVYDSLAAAGDKPVTVLYDPRSASGPVFSSDRYYPVYGIALGAKSVRSFNEIQEAWRADDQIGVWLGAFFMLSSCVLVVCAFLSRAAT